MKKNHMFLILHLTHLLISTISWILADESLLIKINQGENSQNEEKSQTMFRSVALTNIINVMLKQKS